MGSDMPQHIGIVACSAEGAALCYRTICIEGADLMGPHAHPEVSIHTHCLADYMRHIRADDWKGVAELMLSSADKLSKMGADFLISPDNTVHRAYEFVAERSPAAVVTHCSGSRQSSPPKRLPPPGSSGNALHHGRSGLSAKAGRSRHRPPNARSQRTRTYRPDHYGRAGLWHIHPAIVGLFHRSDSRTEGRRLRCRGSGLHRNSAARHSGIIAVAYARLDAAFSASSSAQGGGNY